VARNLSDRSPSDELVRLVDLALVLVADHGLAAPTMAARLVASVGADLHAAVLAGCCAMRGSAPGATALAVEELLGESPASKPAVLVAARLERGEPVPGVGHPLYPDHDPRAAHLLRELRGSYDGHPALDVVTGLADALTAAGQPAPNLDFALGALSYVARLRRGAGEAIFTLGRVAGFIAHCMEQYASATRYRLNAVYVGPGPTSTYEGSTSVT
jgi:citrate synthase